MPEHWTWNGSFVPPGEPIPGKSYRADGWSYRDFLGQWFTVKVWDEMVTSLGKEGRDFVYLAASSRPASGERPRLVRGQLLISPAGERDLKAWAHSKSLLGPQ